MNESSIQAMFSYTPQPLFYPPDGSNYLQEVDLSADSNHAEWESIENENGLFDPDLSNYTTFDTTTNNQSPHIGDSIQFTIRFPVYAQSLANARSTMTVGLIGCALYSYQGTAGNLASRDLDTEKQEIINYSIEVNGVMDVGVPTTGKGFALCTNNGVETFGKEPLRGIISGGRTNLIASGMGGKYIASPSQAEVVVTLHVARIGRSHLKFIVGHLFIGIDVPLDINTPSLVWTMGVRNNRFIARDFGTKNSDGTLVRNVDGEFFHIPYLTITGSEIRFVHADNLVQTIYPDASLFNLLKVNTSYPVLFNPYPYPIEDGTLTKEQFQLTARQNFFSIYGFLQGDMEIQADRFQDALDSKYRMKFRFNETR